MPLSDETTLFSAITPTYLEHQFLNGDSNIILDFKFEQRMVQAFLCAD
jgi:hypothetical protein